MSNLDKVKSELSTAMSAIMRALDACDASDVVTIPTRISKKITQVADDLDIARKLVDEAMKRSK